MTLALAVCVKVVPKTEDVTFDREKGTLDRAKAENVLNPADKNALELALRLRAANGGTVHVVSMGPPFARDLLDLCVGMGADGGVLASDRAFAGADTFPTSLVLARAVRRLHRADLVLCGEESADAATGQVPGGVAAWLDVPQVTAVDDASIDGDRVIAHRALGDVREVVAARLPALLAIATADVEPRFPDFRRVERSQRERLVDVVTAADLGLRPDEVGLAGSFTVVRGLVEGESPERRHAMIAGDVEAQARAIARAIRGRARRA